MTADFRIAIPHILQAQALPVDKYGHLPRLYNLTRQIGEGLDYDDDVVFAAVWLHDLGVFVGNRPEDPVALQNWDHVSFACERVPELLASTDFPAEKIPAVLEAIRTHQPQDDPQTIEATILRDADILEQLGAIGLLRNISKVGRDTRYARFSNVIPVLRKFLTELPPRIRLKHARELAKPRIELLAGFLDAVEDEAAGSLH